MKRDEHGADVDGELQAVARSIGQGIEEIRAESLLRTRRSSSIGWVWGTRIFGDHQRRRRRHERRAQQEFRVCLLLNAVVPAQDPDISDQHAAGDRRHAAGHQREQLGPREFRDIWFDHQRRFRLPEKNLRRRRQTLGSAQPHELLRHPGEGEYHLLQHAEVIEHRTERREEHDGRQDVEGEDISFVDAEHLFEFPGSPSTSPKTNFTPAPVKSLTATKNLASWPKIQSPPGTARKISASKTCNARPPATSRQSILLRFSENRTPIASKPATPRTERRRSLVIGWFEV